MQTPIDFGKSFLNSYFSVRDPDLCLEDMAYDVVWITPKQMYHFRTAKEIRDFLEQEMTAKPARYYVDIVSIKSSPSAADISTVAYEINLVSKEEEKAVYLFAAAWRSVSAGSTLRSHSYTCPKRTDRREWSRSGSSPRTFPAVC